MMRSRLEGLDDQDQEEIRRYFLMWVLVLGQRYEIIQ
jgi:hypothetical protein